MRRQKRTRDHAVNPAGLRGARTARLPDRFSPQIPEPATSVPSGAQWIHEPQLEGFRVLARLEHGRVRLFDGERRWLLPPLERALGRLPCAAALLDGQVVALRTDGTSSFVRLREAVAAGKLGRLVYQAFDLLHLDGYDLTAVALVERKRALRELLASGPAAPPWPVRYLHHFEGNGSELYTEVCGLGLAGLVSKLRTSRYRSGTSAEWVEVASRRRGSPRFEKRAIDRPRLASLGRVRVRPAQLRSDSERTR